MQLNILYTSFEINIFVPTYVYFNIFDTKLPIGTKEFKNINWIPTKERAAKVMPKNMFKYWKGIAPLHVNQLFIPSDNSYRTRSQTVLDIQLRQSNIGQKNLLYQGPSAWSKSDKDIKSFSLSQKKYSTDHSFVFIDINPA